MFCDLCFLKFFMDFMDFMVYGSHTLLLTCETPCHTCFRKENFTNLLSGIYLICVNSTFLVNIFSSLTSHLIILLLFLLICATFFHIGQNNASVTRCHMWEALMEGQRLWEAGCERVSGAGTITCLLGWKRRADSRGGTENLASSVGVIMGLL